MTSDHIPGEGVTVKLTMVEKSALMLIGSVATAAIVGLGTMGVASYRSLTEIRVDVQYIRENMERLERSIVRNDERLRDLERGSPP